MIMMIDYNLIKYIQRNKKCIKLNQKRKTKCLNPVKLINYQIIMIL